MDGSGNVYVADYSNERIQKFDSSGTYLTQWGSYGTGNGQFNTPSGVAADGSGNIYVADSDNQRIQVFDNTGIFKGTWGSPGTGNGQFNGPNGMSTNATGSKVYVADTYNNRIQAFVGYGVATYTLTYTAAGVNGYISGTTPQTVSLGGSGTLVTAVANSGYHFLSWSDGVTTPSRTDANVTTDINVTASFAVNPVTTYTLTYIAAAHGTISGTTPQNVNSGGSGTPVTAVANFGYHFVSWSDGVTNAARTDANVTTNINVTASFAAGTQYTLTFVAGSANGIINGVTPQIVIRNSNSMPVMAVPNTGYRLVNWTGTSGFRTTTANPLTVSRVTASQTITANFALIKYTIIFSAGLNGSINGSKIQSVAYGGSTSSVMAVPNRGHQFVNWTGSNGFVTTTANPLILNNVTASQSIKANFR